MSQNFATNIFNAFPAPSLLISVDSTFTIQSVNLAYQQETKMTANELVGKSILTYFADNKLDFVALEQSLLQVISTKQTHKIFVKNTAEQKIELENIPVFDENQEINAIIQSYKFLNNNYFEDTKKRLELFKKYTKESYAIIDKNLNLISFNEKFAKQAKDLLKRDLKKGMSFLDLVLPERKEFIKEKYNFVLHGSKIEFNPEVTTETGSTINLKSIDEPILNEFGEVVGVFVTVIDETTLIEIDKKQKDQELHFKALIENIPELVYSLDLNFNLITFNSTLSSLVFSLTGLKLEPGMNILKLYGEHKREKYTNVLKRVINEGRCVFEDHFIFNNENVLFEVAVNPIFNENKQLIGVTIFANNITQEKYLKKKEEEQRVEYRALIDNISDVVYSLDMDLNLITFNKALVDASIYLIGRPPQKGMNLIENFAFDKKDFLRSKFSEASVGKAISFMYEETIFDELQIFEVYINPIFNDNALQIGYSVLSKVVTEKVKAERAKDEILHRLNNIMSLSLDVICTIDNKGIFTNVNEAAYNLIGYHPEELIGKSSFDFVYPEDLPRSIEMINNLDSINNTCILENRYVHKDGRVIDVLGTIRKESEEGVLYCTAKDITEKKANEARLNESLYRYKYLFENNPAPMYIFDFETLQIIDCNAEALYLYGYEREEFLRLSLKDIRPAEELPFILDITSSEESFGEIKRTIARHSKKSGEIIVVEVTGHLVELEGKKVGLTQIKDVTEQERALRELKENEAKLRSATIIAKLAYWQLDLNRYFSTSSETYIVFGIQEECQINYDSWLNAIHPDDKQLYQNAENAAFNRESEIDIEIRIIVGKGIKTLQWIHIRGKEVIDEIGRVIALEGTIQNITEKKKIQIDLQERNSFIETALENLPIGISVDKIDDGVNTLINKKFEEIYGWSKESLIDRSTFFEKVFPNEAYRTRVLEQFKSDMSSGDLSRMGWEGVQITTQKGEQKVVRVTNIPVPEQNLIISTVIDDTERVKAEKKLILSNERYNLVTQATSDAIWDWDLVSNSFFRGGSFEKIFGHKVNSASLSIDSWSVYLHPEDADRVLSGMHAAIESDTIKWKDEYRYLKADGKYAYVMDKGFILRDNHGKAIRMVGAMQDITERNEREQQLKLFESVVINANDAILITEPEPFDEPGPKIMYANKAFTKMTGYEVEEIIGKTPRILQGPKSDFKELARLSQALRKWESCEVTTINYKKNGEEFWVNFTVTPVANEKGWFTHWIAIERDITEKVNYERDLIEANNKVITTLESIRDGFYSMDKNWVVTYWNKEMEVLTEVNRTDIIGKNIWEQFPFMLDTKFYIEYKRAVAENVVVRFEEHLNLTEQWFEANAFPSENGLTVFIRDITERKLNEQKIKSERKLLRTLIDNLPDSIFFKDTKARKLISNKVDLRLQGVSSEEEVLGKTDAEIYPNKPSCVGYEQDLEILRTGKSVLDYEESFMSNDGQLSWYLTSKMLVYDDNKNVMGLLGIGRDITERKLAEQKLEAVNKELLKNVQQLLISNAELEQFAYVASHDLQEPLRMITSFLSQIERKYKDVIDEKGKQYIYFAVDGAKRMRQIILDLLEFSRVGRMEDKQELVNLNDLVNDILILYRKQIKEKKAIIHLDTLPTVKASKSSMRQVFQNLISNSLKYVTNIEGVVPQIKITVESVNNEWMIAIKD
uniref:PAS domain S-box protein n=1 Tax=Emticicia oligotrophica TaxID=312279 RepID=UPI0030EE8C5C